MSFGRQSYSVDADIQWRFSFRDVDAIYGGVLADGNGTTAFGKVARGTILGRLANNTLRPCGFVRASAAGAAVNIFPGEATNFFVADVVDVIAGAARATAIVAGDNPSNLTVTPKVASLNLDIVVAGTSTSYSSAYVAATNTLTINSATDGGGAATTTVADIVADLLANYSHLIESAEAETGADLVVDVGPTDLGPIAGTAIASSRNVTAVDKDAGEITIDGAAITFAENDILRLAVGWQPVGILDRAENTIVQIDGENLEMDQSCKYATSGDAIPSKLAGYDAIMAAAMAGGNFDDLDGTGMVSQVSFVLREL